MGWPSRLEKPKCEFPASTMCDSDSGITRARGPGLYCVQGSKSSEIHASSPATIIENVSSVVML